LEELGGTTTTTLRYSNRYFLPFVLFFDDVLVLVHVFMFEFDHDFFSCDSIEKVVFVSFL